MFCSRKRAPNFASFNAHSIGAQHVRDYAHTSEAVANQQQEATFDAALAIADINTQFMAVYYPLFVWTLVKHYAKLWVVFIPSLPFIALALLISLSVGVIADFLRGALWVITLQGLRPSEMESNDAIQKNVSEIAKPQPEPSGEVVDI
mmetsp:Transcript_17169/g.19140  ORF Transcript_17169/g.19140 Transcript_17169/m.19140 type:complete len:148 (+) Transcript_17169:154-597(+)